MSSFLRALHAEALKLRRTLALWMVFVAPLMVVVLQFFLLYDRGKLPEDGHAWEMLYRSSTSVWAIFMLPLFITLETALLNGLEHGARGWKHLFALPVPRGAVYAAKVVVMLVLIAVSTLVLWVGTAASGLALRALQPELHLAGPPPWGMGLALTGTVYLASLLILALHSWVSMRWSSFALALGVGIGGTFFAVFAAGWKYGGYYPWLMPVYSLNEESRVTALTLGVLGGLVLFALGGWEATRRDVS